MSLTSPSPSPAAIAPDEGTIHTGTVSSVHSYGSFIKIPGYAKQGTRLFHSCVATPVESYCSHLNNAHRHAAPLPGPDVRADSARARAKGRGTRDTATGPAPRHESEPGVALNVGAGYGKRAPPIRSGFDQRSRGVPERQRARRGLRHRTNATGFALRRLFQLRRERAQPIPLLSLLWRRYTPTRQPFLVWPFYSRPARGR